MKNVFTRSRAIAALLALILLVGIAPAAMASTADPIDQVIAVGFEEEIEIASIKYEPTSFSVKNESGDSGISFLSVNTEKNGEYTDLTVTVNTSKEGKWQLSYSYSYRKSGSNKTKEGVINLVTYGYVEPTPTPEPTAEPTPEPEEEVIVEPVVEPEPEEETVEEEPVEEEPVEEEPVEEEPVEETVVEPEPINEEPVEDSDIEGFVVDGEDETQVEPTEDQRYLFGGLAVLQYTLDTTDGNSYAAIGNMYTACDGLPGINQEPVDGILNVDADTLSAWYTEITGKDLGYNGEDFDLSGQYGISCSGGTFTLTPGPVRYTTEIINMEECGASFNVEVLVNGTEDGGHFEFMVYSAPSELGWTLSDM